MWISLIYGTVDNLAISMDKWVALYAQFYPQWRISGGLLGNGSYYDVTKSMYFRRKIIQ